MSNRHELYDMIDHNYANTIFTKKNIYSENTLSCDKYYKIAQHNKNGCDETGEHIDYLSTLVEDAIHIPIKNCDDKSEVSDFTSGDRHFAALGVQHKEQTLDILHETSDVCCCFVNVDISTEEVDISIDITSRMIDEDVATFKSLEKRNLSLMIFHSPRS
ncbi:hypothetical protein BDF21DRAFT_455345 [Thamnidium elegans]|nr:hypothetical protein BDF21DRAFT_455345 [Thamnidium elegans]